MYGKKFFELVVFCFAIYFAFKDNNISATKVMMDNVTPIRKGN